MHRSVVLERMRRGEAIFCVKLNITDPNVIEMVGHLGHHCVWLCTEHGPVDLETVYHQVRAAKMLGIDSMVRVPKGSYSDYIRPLEMDATGIMVPHVMSGEEAREIVRQTKFHPVGLRPWDSGNSDGPFCQRSPGEYMKFANEQRFVLVQIEDKEAVDCMEDIVAVDGVDVVFLGPGDLSQSYGVPGETSHPLIQEATQKLAALCKKHNRFWGLPSSPEQAPKYIEMGAQFLAGGADVVGLWNHFHKLREDLKCAGLSFESQF